MFFDRQVVQFGRKLLPPLLGPLKMEAAVYCNMSLLYLSIKLHVGISKKTTIFISQIFTISKSLNIVLYWSLIIPRNLKCLYKNSYMKTPFILCMNIFHSRKVKD